MIKIEDGPHPRNEDLLARNKDTLEKQVYCKNCRWLRKAWLPPFTEKCVHPSNWKPTWKKRVRDYPWNLNANNNCDWYAYKS